MPKAKSKRFYIGPADVPLEEAQPMVRIHGRMTIKGSPQGNMRHIFALLTLDEAKRLEFQLHQSILLAEGQGEK